jgi:hypothetical protein
MPEINQEFDVQYNENAQVCDVITDTLDVVSQYLRTGYVNREHWVLVLPREGMVMDPKYPLSHHKPVHSHYIEHQILDLFPA